MTGFVEFRVTIEPLTNGVRVTLDDGSDRAPVVIFAATAEAGLRMAVYDMAAAAAPVLA